MSATRRCWCNNRLTITQGTSVVLTSANLSATDADDDDANLIFNVSGVTGGRFELVATPGVAITDFTQAQVVGGTVRFVHDGGTTAPTLRCCGFGRSLVRRTDSGEGDFYPTGG